MKRTLSLFFALFAFVVFAKGQAILSEGFENGLPTGWTVIDADNDTYNWDAVTPVGVFTAHTGTGLISSASYDNTAGALTPNNYLVTPQINLTAAANLTYWVCAQDAAYPAEHYAVYISTTGNTAADFTTVLYEETLSPTSRVQTPWISRTISLANYTGNVYIAFRHFNCTDQFWLNLDDVEVFAQPTSPTIIANSTTQDFGHVIIGNNSPVLTNTITTYNLSNNVTATTQAPFEVSSDGITFSTTATIDSTGGTLYVRCSPTQAGNNTGTVTLSSTGATNVTITYTVFAVDCSQDIATLPWSEDFENDVFPPSCWEVIQTGDETWTSFDNNGDHLASVLGGEILQNEKLITPTFDFSNYQNSILLNFEFLTNYEFTVTNAVSNLRIFASIDGGLTFSTTPLWDARQIGEFATWIQTPTTANLSSLAGQSNVKLAFVYEGTAGAQFLIDNLEMVALDEPIIMDNDESYSFYIEIGDEDVKSTVIASYNLTTDITVTTTAPFSVSNDGVSYSQTTTLSEDGGALYFKYAPTAAGTHNATATLSATGASNVVIDLNGTAYDCSGDNFPLNESFESEVAPAGCWTLIYGDNDPSINTMIHTSEAAFDGEQSFRFSSFSSSNSYDQYLVSPEMNSDVLKAITFKYVTLGFGNETFRVGYSATDDINSFTWGETISTAATAFTDFYMQAPTTAKYIAIHYFSDYLYYLYVDGLQVFQSTGIENNDNSVSVYPNPASNMVNISANSPISTIELFSVSGQKIISTTETNTSAQINVSQLSNGIYFLRIMTENGPITKKITIAQ